MHIDDASSVIFNHLMHDEVLLCYHPMILCFKSNQMYMFNNTLKF